MSNERQMLNKCKKVIQQLQEELTIALKRNKEQQELIKILTNQKQFYTQTKYQQQQQYLNLKNQSIKTNHIIQSLRTSNQSLVQQVAEIKKQIQQKNFLLQAQDKLITRVKQEKSILQKQWGRVVNSVKGKLYTLNLNQQKNNKINYHQKSLDSKVYQILKHINMKIAEDQIQNLIQLKKDNQSNYQKSMNLQQEQKVDRNSIW